MAVYYDPLQQLGAQGETWFYALITNYAYSLMRQVFKDQTNTTENKYRNTLSDLNDRLTNLVARKYQIPPILNNNACWTWMNSTVVSENYLKYQEGYWPFDFYLNGMISNPDLKKKIVHFKTQDEIQSYNPNLYNPNYPTLLVDVKTSSLNSKHFFISQSERMKIDSLVASNPNCHYFIIVLLPCIVNNKADFSQVVPNNTLTFKIYDWHDLWSKKSFATAGIDQLTSSKTYLNNPELKCEMVVVPTTHGQEIKYEFKIA